MSAAASSESGGDGPVLTLVNKKLRALKKKYNKILLLEASVSSGSILNEDQLQVLRSKPSVLTLIDEYEKLRQPLSVAIKEEVDAAIVGHFPPPPPPPQPVPVILGDGELLLADVLRLIYFGVLFDVKPQSDFTNLMLARTRERQCCLATEDEDASKRILGEKDFDLLALLGGKIASRPPHSDLPHWEALHSCLQHAKLWLCNSDEPIGDGVDVTYAAVRQKLNKILGLEYMTMRPEMKAPAEVAGQFDIPVPASSATTPTTTGSEEEETDHFDGQKTGADQSSPVEELPKEELEMPNSVDDISVKQEKKPENDEEHQGFINVEPRRGHKNYRGGNQGGVGGRRGYPNGRGGRNNRGGGYQNGRGQYYDQSGNYHPTSYYNTRGRGGAGRGAGGNGNHGGEEQHN